MKLRPKDIKAHRDQRLALHNGACALCQQPCVSPVLDHCHSSGFIRDTICRSCNSGLGAIERTKRYGIKNVVQFAEQAAKYLKLHSTPQSELLHPLHLSLEERKVKAKRRAKRKRAK